MIFNFVISFIAGYIYGHFFEYFAHKHILHNYKDFKVFFKNHFGRHHKVARSNHMFDSAYSALSSRANFFEIKSLSASVIIHLPIALLSVGFFSAVVFSAVEYYIIHRKSHTDIEWCKKNLPWHFSHHIGNQNKNFGIRSNFVDKIMGTD